MPMASKSITKKTPSSMEQQNETTRKPLLLSLDGGVDNGLQTLLALQQLFRRIDPDNPPKPCHVFDMIGGSGAGGLIAIMLGRLGLSVDDCIRLYRHVSPTAFQTASREGFWPLVPGWSTYKSRQLEDVIKTVLQACGEAPGALLETNDEGHSKVLVCATRCLDDSHVNFTSFQGPGDNCLGDGIKIWEAARATTAAPDLFEPITVGPQGLRYVSAGIGASNPVFQTRTCARHIWQASGEMSFDEQIYCVVSVGTAVRNCTRERMRVAPKEVSWVLVDSETTANKFTWSHEHLVDANKYFRLTTPSDINSIDSTDDIGHVMIQDRIFAHLRDNCSSQLEQCADVLRDHRSWRNSRRKRTRIDFSMLKKSPSWSGFWSVFLACFGILTVIGLGYVSYVTALPPIDHSAPIVALFGQTGVGKSTFINTLGGQHISTRAAPAIGHTLHSETSRISWYRATIDGRTVYLIDTPGFDDHREPDFTILEHISQELRTYYPNGRLLNGIVWLYNVAHYRVGGKGMKALEYFKLLLGDEAFSSCMLTTSHWDLTSPENLRRQQAHEEALKQEFWKDMIDGGSILTQHDNTTASARRIVTYLVDKPKMVLTNQHERIDERKRFLKTKAGRQAGIDKGRIQDSTLRIAIERANDEMSRAWNWMNGWVWGF